MNLYRVVHNDESFEEYASIFDAYLAVDSDGVFLPLKEYIEVKLSSVNTCTEFINFIDFLNSFSNIISTNIQAKYNVEDINKISVLITGSNNNANTTTLMVLNNEYFLTKFNSLLSNLGYNDYIVKNDEYIKYNLKEFLMNHVKVFLEVTDYLVDNNYYSSWSHNKYSNEQLQELGINKADDFNDNDPYVLLDEQVLKSANQFKVLSAFMEDIDNIVDIIIDKNEILLTMNLDREFLNQLS